MTIKTLKFLAIVFSPLLITNTEAQIFINEVSCSNDTVIQDEDGDTPDWIELYNSGGSAVNLGGFWISDNPLQPDKWIFPNGVMIPATAYITLFASGKDRKEFFNHWETVVYADDSWRYTVPFIEPDTNWRILPGFNDLLWSLGSGGIGYGDGDDASIISPPVNSVFMRRVFSIADTADIASAVFHFDYDDAFVAYINGVEIARSNIGQNGIPTPYNNPAFAEHEAKMYAGGKPDQYFLDEPFLKSILVNGNNVLAIQVHNVSPTSSDMTSLAWLSLGIKSTSSNYGTVPAWFNLSASTLHTNFKLSQNGETIVFSNSGGSIVDQVATGNILTDNSFGRQQDGAVTWVYFRDPTPNSSNNLSAGYSGYTGDPDFSIDGGFYTSALSLILSSSTSGATIRFTTDGSLPVQTSTVYTVPLIIDSTVVVRARTFHPSLLEGNSATNTYFISDSSSLSLPVISISFEPSLFFDPLSGVYVKGPNADPFVPFFGANFWQEKEVSIHIEFYDKQRQLGFEQDAGLEIYGNYSRSYPQKSMKIIADENSGSGSFDYQLFNSKDIHSFKQFILRNSGTDWNRAHMKDAFVHTLALKSTENDVMAYQPTVVYLNGQYWGVYNMREKINKYYLEGNHGADPDSIDLLQYNGLVISGTNENFIQTGIFIVMNDMTDPAKFAVADSMIDLKNFADYFAVETWSNNWDWLTNNVRYWRENKEGEKWRYILWDLDNGMGGAWSYIENSLDTNLNKPLDYTSILFNKLIQNESYKHYFINRYADLLNTVFVPQNCIEQLHKFRDTIDAEMPRHFYRWGQGFNNPDWGVAGNNTYNGWRNYELPEVEVFCSNRQITARNHIQETFSLKKQVPVALNVYPPYAGKILINTITIDDLPWGGIYFDSVPITITAIPNPGYQFSFWQSGILFQLPQSDSSLTFNPDTSDVFTAYFVGAPDTACITFSEINYRSGSLADAGDWVELYNCSQYPMDISRWKFKDGLNSNMFIIPENTVLYSGDYLVLAQDMIKFNLMFPMLSNVMGPFNFGLSSSVETIRMFDANMELQLSVTFSGSSPWSPDANGTGLTLELLSVSGDLNDPQNWFAGCPGGSPGGPFFPCNNTIEEQIVTFTDGILAVYPNPAFDRLTIEFSPDRNADSAFDICLFDLAGRPVFIRENVQEEKVTIFRNFEPGMYIYRVSSDDGYLKTGKVVFN